MEDSAAKKTKNWQTKVRKYEAAIQKNCLESASSNQERGNKKTKNKNKTNKKLLVRAVRHVPSVQLNLSQLISTRLAIARCHLSAAVKLGGGVKSCQPAGGETLDMISRGLRRRRDPDAGTLSTITTSLRDSPAQLDPGTHPIFISKDSFRKRRRLFIKPRCAFF